MFGINETRPVPLPVPPVGTSDGEFDVMVQRRLWHNSSLRCSDAILYFIEKTRLEDAVPYTQVVKITVLEDTIVHWHKQRIRFSFKGELVKRTISIPKRTSGGSKEAAGSRDTISLS